MAEVLVRVTHPAVARVQMRREQLERPAGRLEHALREPLAAVEVGVLHPLRPSGHPLHANMDDLTARTDAELDLSTLSKSSGRRGDRVEPRGPQ